MTTLVTGLVIVFTFLGARSSQNAGEWYERAFDEMRKVSPDEREILERVASDPNRPVTSSEIAVIERFRSTRNYILRGTQAPQYERSDQYPDFRDFATLLRADAVHRMQSGDSAGYSQSLVSGYHLATNLAEFNDSLASKQAYFILKRIDATIQSGIERGFVDATAAGRLAKSLREMDLDDPLHFADCVSATFDKMTNKYNQAMESGGADAVEALIERGAGRKDLGELDVQEIREEMATTFLAVRDDILEAAGSGDFEFASKRFKEIVASLETQSQRDLLFWLPALEDELRLLYLSSDIVKARLTSLEMIAKGEGELDNAALWYSRCAAILQSLTVSDMNEIIANGTFHGEGWNVSAKTVEQDKLERVQKGMELFCRAAEIRSCDWAAVQPKDTYFLHEYLPGIAQAINILELRILQTHARGDCAGCLKLFELWCSVINHLSAEKSVIGSALAHYGLQQVRRQLIELQVGEHEEVNGLKRAVERIGVLDTCGYAGSIVNMRRVIISAIDAERGKAAGREELVAGTSAQVEDRMIRHRDRVAQIRTEIAAWSDDHLLVAIIAFDRTWAAKESVNDASVDGIIHRIGKLIDRKEWESALGSQVAYRALIINKGDVYQVTPVPTVVPWFERRKQARHDHQELVQLLQRVQGTNLNPK